MLRQGWVCYRDKDNSFVEDDRRLLRNANHQHSLRSCVIWITIPSQKKVSHLRWNTFFIGGQGWICYRDKDNNLVKDFRRLLRNAYHQHFVRDSNLNSLTTKIAYHQRWYAIFIGGQGWIRTTVLSENRFLYHYNFHCLYKVCGLDFFFIL